MAPKRRRTANEQTEEPSSKTRKIERHDSSAADDNTSPKDAEKPIVEDGITLIYTKADIFQCPSNSVIAHSCNCEGSWGKGFALTLKKKYPHQFETHYDHCKKQGSGLQAANSLRGTALLCPPPELRSNNPAQSHFVACLFVKASRGGRVSFGDTREVILENTKASFEQLLHDMHKQRSERGDGAPGEIHMPKINSGLFRIPWERTAAALTSAKMPEGSAKADWKIVVHER